MRFEGIKIHKLGPFGDVELNLEQVDGPVVAVAGGNGAGKSTLLELLAAGLFRSTPTRGKLAGLATGRDSWVEVQAVNGRSYSIRHMVDANTGKGETLVLDDAGAPVLDDAKVRSFDKWAKTHLPAPEVFYASTFAPQGSGGFLDLDPAARKAVLLRTLGAEHLELLAEKAREHVRECKTKLEVVNARIADVQHSNVEGTEEDLREAQAKVKALESERDAALVSLGAARKAAEENREARAAAERWERESERLEAERGRARGKVADVNARIQKQLDVVYDKDEILAAGKRAEELEEAIQNEALEARKVDAEISDLKHALDLNRRTGLELSEKHSAAKSRANAAKGRLFDRDKVLEAVAALNQLNANTEKAAQDFNEAEEKLGSLRGQRIDGAEQRVQTLRRGLVRIRDRATSLLEARDHASDMLKDDDATERRAAALPAELAAAEKACREATKELRDATKALAEAERLAVRAPDLELAQQDLDVARKEMGELAAQLEACRDTYAQTKMALDNATIRADAITAKLGELHERLAEAKDAARRLADLDAAEVRLEELRGQKKELQRELASVEAKIEGLGEPMVAPKYIGTEAEEGELQRVERMLAEWRADVKVCASKAEAAKEGAERRRRMEVDRDGIEQDLADWTKLSQDLGRNGLQAMEVDAAGPELTELANDLLHTCFGPRWTVSIETQRLDSTGKKTIEGCEVRVIDTERGRDASASSLSGGEKVLVSEAISLALSMLACRRAGVTGATLVRDETGAALDPENAVGYVAMLRRAAELVGASKVLFVSHNAEARDLADAIVWVRDGKVEVQA